ncbi:MAG: hypothetical protein C4519_02845 [Desulfobacteraceae bacterium]|nr:MAG: hypothetical protein C4519_02845 [Desulfobacteraceae bacterium]
MINNISEGTIRTAVKIDPSGSIHEKQTMQQKADEVRQRRPVENADTGSKPESRDPQDSDSSKYLLEDNTLVFEKYDEKGDLIYRVPPNYKPVDERA